jgi:hypothetical protein
MGNSVPQQKEGGEEVEGPGDVVPLAGDELEENE